MSLLAFDVESHLVQPGLLAPPKLKACSSCGEEKPTTALYVRRSRKGGLQHICIECCAAKRRDKKAKARAVELSKSAHRVLARADYRKSAHGRRIKAEATLRERYGIDFEDWARMFEQQRGMCACCADRLHFDQRTHVDHNHATGSVRALVCRGCNIKIGVLESHKFRYVMDYLERAK